MGKCIIVRGSCSIIVDVVVDVKPNNSCVGADDT